MDGIRLLWYVLTILNEGNYADPYFQIIFIFCFYHYLVRGEVRRAYV
jgi:hypothetical protein